MALQLLFQLMLILLSLQTLSPALEAAPTLYPVAKPNCKDTCGDVSLPFPFGIGPGCFLNEWYEIVCQVDGTVSLPRLKKLDLEVLSAMSSSSDFPSNYITVQFPVTFSNSSCGDINHRNVTLDESPFVFSETDNIFFTVGCDVMARLRSTNSTSLIGRMCSGANPNKTFSACSGVGCCSWTPFPCGVQSYSVDFFVTGVGVDEDCRFASFVQQQTWYEPFEMDLYTIKDQGHVPVVLQWGILDSFFITSLVGAELDSTWTNTRFRDANFECGTTSYINQNNTPFMQCRCSNGYAGNPYLLNGCQEKCTDACNFGSAIPGLITYAGIALLVFGYLVSCIWLCFSEMEKKRKQIKIKKKLFKECVDRGIARQRTFSRNDNIQHGKLFSSKELQRATNKYNKDMILGQGGQGTVYKGTMPDGTVVAVKKSSKQMDDGNLKQFINEVVILSLINHRNIVKLLGICLDTDVPLLVYEFIPNGTLYHSLHHPNDDFRMTWDVRLRIAIELAAALSYMHSSTSIPIYHRDIKSTNILLDEKYRAKIADFGTSRTVSLDQTHATTLVQGTFGYLDPEYFRLCRFTDKSDVYSFGVVLAELLTGQKPIFSLREGEHTSLATYFLHAMQENRLFEIIDKEVVEQAAQEEVEDVAALIKRCLHANGRNRPTMRQVASKLESLRGLPPADDHQVDGNSHEYSMEEYFESEVSCDVTLTSDVCPLKRCPTW